MTMTTSKSKDQSKMKKKLEKSFLSKTILKNCKTFLKIPKTKIPAPSEIIRSAYKMLKSN